MNRCVRQDLSNECPFWVGAEIENYPNHYCKAVPCIWAYEKWKLEAKDQERETILKVQAIMPQDGIIVLQCPMCGSSMAYDDEKKMFFCTHVKY